MSAKSAKLICVAAALSVLMASPGIAVENHISPEKREAIVRFLNVSGFVVSIFKNLSQQMVEWRQTWKNVPDEFHREWEKVYTPETFVNMAIPLWDKHFSLAEINELIQFCESPTGRRYVETFPIISHRYAEDMDKWAKMTVEIIFAKLEKQGIQMEKKEAADREEVPSR